MSTLDTPTPWSGDWYASRSGVERGAAPDDASRARTGGAYKTRRTRRQRRREPRGNNQPTTRQVAALYCSARAFTRLVPALGEEGIAGSPSEQAGHAASTVRDGGGGEGVVGGEGGGVPAGRVRGAGDGVRAAGGAQHADGDRAARQEEGHRQGRPGPLGAGDGGGRDGGVPPAAAAQVLLPRPRRRSQPLPPEQQGLGLDMPPARQGVRVHDVRDDGGGGAGVRDRAGRRARAAVDQALQHLHALLRADRREPRARDPRRRRHRRPLRRLRAQRRPPLPAAVRRALLAAAVGSWRQLGRLRFSEEEESVSNNDGP